jgi:hypothetical protein
VGTGHPSHVIICLCVCLFDRPTLNGRFSITGACLTATNTMITLVYKQVSGLDLQVDIHPPWLSPPGIDTDSAIEEAPAVLFFHGGGLTVGNRTSWFPYWMQSGHAYLYDEGTYVIYELIVRAIHREGIPLYVGRLPTPPS